MRQKHTIIPFIYLLLVHLALAGIIFKFGDVQRFAEKIGLTESRHKWHYRQMLGFHQRIDAFVPDDAVLFIGDSFIQSMCVAAITENAVNYGIGGDTTVGVIDRLSVYKSLSGAKAVVLSAGYNDLRERENSVIVENYREILSKIPEHVNVLFCSVLPTDESCRKERYNDRIVNLNQKAMDLCSSRMNCEFVDLSDDFKDGDGNLKRDYHEGDGIHLNSRGYEISNEIIKALLKCAG